MSDPEDSRSCLRARNESSMTTPYENGYQLGLSTKRHADWGVSARDLQRLGS